MVLSFFRIGRGHMTLGEIIAEVNETKPNTYDDGLFIKWLSQQDGRVFNDVIMTHEHALVEDEDGNLVEPEFHGYTDNSLNDELLICEPYTDTYRYYLDAMIDYSNGETDRYQNSMLMYNNAYQEYKNYYNRTVKPLQKPLVLF